MISLDNGENMNTSHVELKVAGDEKEVENKREGRKTTGAKLRRGGRQKLAIG